MKVLVLGAGVIGVTSAWYLAQAGHDVVFIDMWPDNVEAMRANGLHITHLRNVPEFAVPVRALHITDVQDLAREAPIDIAFVCVKSYDTIWATALINQYLAPHSFPPSLVNNSHKHKIGYLYPNVNTNQNRLEAQ